MIRIIKNKYFSWFIVAIFVCLSPLVLEIAFSKDIEGYNKNKVLYNRLVLNVKDFKNMYYPEKIDKKDSKDLTSYFIAKLSAQKIVSKDMKVISAMIHKGTFKVTIEMKPSSSACVFRNEISNSSGFAQSLTPYKKCRQEYTQYKFVVI